MTDRYARYVGRHILVDHVGQTPFVAKVTGVTACFLNLSPFRLTKTTGWRGPTRIAKNQSRIWLLREGKEDEIAQLIDAETLRHKAALQAEYDRNNERMTILRMNFKEADK